MSRAALTDGLGRPVFLQLRLREEGARRLAPHAHAILSEGAHHGERLFVLLFHMYVRRCLHGWLCRVLAYLALLSLEQLAIWLQLAAMASKLALVGLQLERNHLAWVVLVHADLVSRHGDFLAP